MIKDTINLTKWDIEHLEGKFQLYLTSKNHRIFQIKFIKKSPTKYKRKNHGD